MRFSGMSIFNLAVDIEIDRVHHVLKDKYCVACNAELKREKYRLRDKFGKPTQLGRVVKDLVEQDLCDITTIVVCSKCKYSLQWTNN